MDEKNQTQTTGPLVGPFTLTNITSIKQLTDWKCPECYRVFHRSFQGPNCPLCKVPLERIVERDPNMPMDGD